MDWPIAIVVISVATGATLGLVAPGRGRLLDAVRTFAIVSSVAVVVGRLIPDAVTSEGPRVLIAVAVAFLVPWLIERAANEDPEHDHSSTMGLELSYWGLMIHKLGDGFALGSFSGEGQAGHHHGDVLTAIAAHSVPVTALITLAFTSAHGRTSGYWDRQLGAIDRKICVNCHNPHAPTFPSRPPAPGPHPLRAMAADDSPAAAKD